jgi:hypothetical protein
VTDLEYVKQIANLAKQVESEDLIDWGLLSIDEDETYEFIANSIIEQFNKYNKLEREVMIATITKLVVENFVLNLKLQQQGK